MLSINVNQDIYSEYFVVVVAAVGAHLEVAELRLFSVMYWETAACRMLTC